MLCDTGPMVAMILRNDQHYAVTVKTMRSLPDTRFLSTWSCLTEALHLLGRDAGWEAQDELLDYFDDGLIALHQAEGGESQRVRQLMAKYRDTPMDLADATLITAAESLGETTIFTFDHHFRIYQLNDRTPVNVVP